MRAKEFLKQLDDRRIVEAIGKAESRTSGEIRVYVSEQGVDDALREAKAHFLRLGMDKTRARNGVLIYIAPLSRTFAIVGDVAVHQMCGDTFWSEIAARMEDHLKHDRYTEALAHAVDHVGEVLATHFPRANDDRNELPDDLARG